MLNLVKLIVTSIEIMEMRLLFKSNFIEQFLFYL